MPIPASLDPTFRPGASKAPVLARKSFYGPFRRPWFAPVRSLMEATRNEAEAFLNREVGAENVVSVAETCVGSRCVVTVWFRGSVAGPKVAGGLDDLA